MQTQNQDFYQCLLKGFVSEAEKSKPEFLPDLLTNNPSKQQKVLTSLIQELESCDEFWFSIAFVTTSGVASIMNTLLNLKQKKIKGKILASKYLNFTQPLALARLLKNFPNIKLKIVEKGDFHAKSYLLRKGSTYNMIVGSSNLTAAALSTNKEWNLKISAKEDSYIVRVALDEFTEEFNKATRVTEDWLYSYSKIYNNARILNKQVNILENKNLVIKPNSMQNEALKNLQVLRSKGATKALLISATGTGKTYLSAFDVASLKTHRCLFVVHRLNIAQTAKETFEKVLGKSKTYGLYSSNQRNLKADIIFTTIQTISRESNLNQFHPNHFDYIIIDETHRAGAESYKRIIKYFKPQFLLGMTATPERTDGLDIFSLFDHNIAYEIRLHRALEEEMLANFHYYGVQDLTIDGKIIEDKSEFRFLESKERVNNILKTSEFYGTDSGIVRGLVFCSRKEECQTLSLLFNKRGYKSVALTSNSSELDRKNAIRLLESNSSDRLDYIFTVDIFNEGIDIPKVNQILMLRPTNSAIIFIQQLGRGLRKAVGKDYVTIIDFIGNYQNNYLVPIALYGDTSFNKDTLRKMISGGSSIIPGASTINFDKVTKERIYRSIDSANMQLKKDLDKDYDLLKFKIGHQPMMMDFINHGSRDPYKYVSYSKSSFFSYAANKEKELQGILSEHDSLLLKYFSKEINNSKRVEESIILLQLITNGDSSFRKLNSELESRYGYRVNKETFESALNNLELKYSTQNHQNKLKKVALIYNFMILKKSGEKVLPGPSFTLAIQNDVFKKYLLDNTLYSIHSFTSEYREIDYVDGFVRYRKYSRKDCFRVLNWDEEPLAQNVGGYMFHPKDYNCPIFVNYHKEDDISDTTKYEDRFIDTSTITYMSKSKRKLNSPDVVKFQKAKELKIRLPMFIKKENAEGDDFYYMGDVIPISESFTQTSIGKEKPVSVVKMTFRLDKAVDLNMFNYITKDKA